MNNLLKSIFISVFTTLALAFLLHGSTKIITSGMNLGWIGALLAATTIAAFFIWLFVGNNARTSRKLRGWTAMVLAGFGLTLAGLFFGNSTNTTSFYYGVILLGGWAAYVLWYSRLDSGKQVLKPGETLPEFSLETFEQEPVDSKTFRERPTLFLFYRGNWCPLCMAQIREIAGQYQQIIEKGVEIVLVSPQPHRYSRSLAKKFDAPFKFLVDKNNKAARMLGIDQPFGLPAGFQILGYKSETVLPTIIITDAGGKIAFIDVADNYRVRPEPETFLNIINQLPTTPD